MDNISVIGAGSWGTALALALASKQYSVSMWVRSPSVYKTILLKRCNESYLPGIKIPDNIKTTLDIREAVKGKRFIFLAVPSMAVRSMLREIKPYLSEDAFMVSCAKGFEPETFQRLSQVMEEELPHCYHSRLAVISGPNHAEEVSRAIPTATVASSSVLSTAEVVQELLMNPYLRVYTNPDIIGVELGGALKNIIALGSGIVEGLKLGDNTRAALITRGLVEIIRLGTALGAQARTFTGLSGMGDLFVTCASVHSRNRRVGLLLGEGKRLSAITGQMYMVAEGIGTTRVAYNLSGRLKVEMPITREIYHVLFEGKDPLQAVEALMEREKKGEIEDIVF